MGGTQSSKVQDVEVESSDKRVHIDKSEVIITPTSFDILKNVLVACQSHQFTDSHVQAVVFVEGSGVIRIGLSTLDPRDSENFLKGSVFEMEEGFDNEDIVHRRVLYRSKYGNFCFGHDGSERDFNSENKETSLWLYIIYVYGKPEVSAQIYHDVKDEEGDEIKLHVLNGTDSVASDDVDPNTVKFRASAGIVIGRIYRIEWDMRLNQEKIAGSSPRPSHGYMKLCLVSKGSRESKSGTTLWEWSSAVKDFPFSSLIAFRVSLAEQNVTHNLLVNSVGKTQTDKLKEELRKECSMYLTIECSGGHIHITHSNTGLILQELGSTLLVSDYSYKTGMSAADIMLEIAAELQIEPRRIQFGDSPTTFVVEFNRRFDQNEIITVAKQLGVKIKPLQETKTVQVICMNNETFEDESELIMIFSHRNIGGGSIYSVEKDTTDPFCWLITFKSQRAARRLWMSKLHRIKTGNKEIKTLVLPWYKELGLAINKGDLPNYDRSPLTVTVDRTKLGFILKNKKEKENFVRAITNKVKVNVKFSNTKKSVDIDTDEDDSDEERDKEETADDSVTFDCHIEDSDVKQLSSWKNVCRKEVQHYFENHLHKKELKIKYEQWETALNVLQNNSEGRKFYCENNEETCTLLLIASDAKVIDEEADRIRRYLNMPKEISRIVQIDSKYYLALDAERMLDKIRSECPNTAMKVNQEMGIVSFKGPEDEVDKAETEVLRLATGIRIISISIGAECEKFLNTVHGKEAVEKIFKERCINPDFIVYGNEIKVHVYALKEAELDQKKLQITRTIEELLTCYIIEGNERKTLTGHPWEVRKRKVIKDCGPLVIIDDKNAVKVYGTLTAVEAARKEIGEYMQQYKKEQESILVSVEVAQFLENCKIYDNKVECLKDSTGNLTGKVCIHGTAAEVAKLTSTITTEMKSINAHWFYLNKKWVASLAEEFLLTFKQREELLLQIEYGQSLAAQGITGAAVLSNLGVIIQVRQGDITLETTHVIVNPVTGDKKSFDKGLGAYITCKGGEEIKSEFMEKHRHHELSEQRKLEEQRKQEAALAESQAQISQNADSAERRDNVPMNTSFDFPVGETILTGQGCLRCMSIMHVVVPPWVQGDPSAERNMKMFVNKVLQKCDNLGLTSVSFPLLVCRNSPYPVEKATSYIIEAVAEYITKGNSKIKEIIMCDTSKGVINEFTKALGKLQDQWSVFQHGLEIIVEDLISSSIRRSGNSQNTFKRSALSIGGTLSQKQQFLEEEGNTRGPNRPGSSDLRWRGNSQPVRSEVMYKRLQEETSDIDDIFDNGFPFNVSISANMKLHVKKGDLTKETVDVVVCTTPEFPDLKGEVAKAVLSAGGESIIQECKTLGPITEGELRATGRGQLPCREIFHVLIPKKWNDKTGEKFVYQVVSMCLYEAAKQSSTIAFPVIGSGNTGFPPDIVARAMVKAIRDFDRSNSSITDVSIVIYSKADAVAKVFEQTLPALFKKTPSNSADQSHTSQNMTGSKRRPRDTEAAYAPPASFSKHSKVDDVVIVKVISKNKGKTIQKEIEQFVEKEYMTKTLNFKALTNEQTLTQEEEKKIRDLSYRFGIEVEIDKNTCIITLRGIRNRVSDCEIVAVSLLQNDFPRQRLLERAIERITAAEQWYYFQENESMKPVEKTANYEIWRGHKEKNDFSYKNRTTGIQYNVHYIADGEMEEWPSNEPQKKRRLVLPTKDHTGEDIPSNWTLNHIKEDKAQVPLMDNQPEFSEVKRKFFEDFDGQKPTHIVKITRLEDRFKWKEYQIKKKSIELRNPQAENEKRLWHGTGADVVAQIIERGFDRGFVNTAVYGEGVYFAAKSSYSDRDKYARPDDNGVKRMFLTRVLTGVHCVGNQNLVVLPNRPGYTFEGCPVPFDSAVDTLPNPCIFVIFNDTQYYPEYLIEYKK